MPTERTLLLIACNIGALSIVSLLNWLVLIEPEYPPAMPTSTSPTPSRLFNIEIAESSIALEENPLFVPTRTRINIDIPHLEPTPDTIPAIPHLIGIIGKGEIQQFALLENNTGDQRKLVANGDIFDNWLLVSISSKTVTLRPAHQNEQYKDSRDIIISLRSPNVASGTLNDE
jgi:hypothetical protein